MRVRTVILAATLALASPGARAADLVVWWEEGFYAEEEEAVRELVTAFAQKTGRDVELAFHPQPKLPGMIETTLAPGGRPPDFAFGLWLTEHIPPWAYRGRLADLSEEVGPFADLFNHDAIGRATLLNGNASRRALYALPMGRSSNHVHIWKSLLERAGFTLADIPVEWGQFWSFWCDQVQPAVRKALGREDVWGVGLAMSAEPFNTWFQFFHFMIAHGADYVTPDGRLVIDDPGIQRRLVEAMVSYTAFYRKGCTPPDTVSWMDAGNNERFHSQAVVMTPNLTLSTVNALKRERPDDYYENTATIEWPLGPHGERSPVGGDIFLGVVLKDGQNVSTAREFVRFLVGEGWLGHYLDFAGERMLPPMRGLLEQPFWQDPSDPHRMAAAMQAKARPLAHDYPAVTGDWRHEQVEQERVWGRAIQRVAAEGVGPEQAVDEAIARIKQILSE